MRGARILLCEDNRETRWALATVLRQEGAEVTEAKDGNEGLALLARGAFDLVISDVSMPGLGGFGVFAALRFGEGDQFAAHRGVPIMIVSGRASRGELARALDAGVDEFMIKPPDTDEFKARVRQLLRRSKRNNPPKSRTAGDLRDFGMRSLGQALHTAGRNARLAVHSGERSGFLDFLHGRIVHAECDAPGVQLRGEAAAVEVLAMEEGVFQIQELPPSVIRSVFDETEALLLRACARADEYSTSQPVTLTGVNMDQFRRPSPTTSGFGPSRPRTGPVPRPPTTTSSVSTDSIRSRPVYRDDNPTTGRVFENGGAGTQEVNLDEILESEGGTMPAPPAEELETLEPPTPGSVYETAMEAGAFDLDDDRDDARPVRGKTAQVLGGALDPAALFAEEDDERFDVSGDDATR